MVEKDIRLAVLHDARHLLDKEVLSDNEKDEILKLLDVLIVAVEKFAPPEKLEDEVQTLTEKLISSQALLELAKQQADELSALKVLSLNLTSSLDLPTVLDAVVTEAIRLVENTRIVHIFLYSNGRIEFGASLNGKGEKDLVYSEPRDNGITATVARKGEMIIVEDISKDDTLFKDVPKEWSGSIVGIPLKMGERVVGVMNLSRHSTGGFSKVELRLLELLADQAAVAISNASIHQLISKKAYTDTITGLANRRALDERLDSEIINSRRTKAPLAVVMMDLDGFKRVNDTYGHEVGDLVLRAVFNVVAVGLRSTDFIARYGGDELALVLPQSNMNAANLVTNKILENLAKFKYAAPDNSFIKMGISGGIAIYPDHGRSGSDLLRAADAALYVAKKRSRGNFVKAKLVTTAPLKMPDQNEDENKKS